MLKDIWNRGHSLQALQAMSDEALCQEARKGCYEAYLVLFDRYWRQVFRLANAVLHDEGEAEDVAQALFLEVHRNMLQFDSERGSFRTLLLRYAYTRAIDQRRRLESRSFYSSLELEDVPSATIMPTPSLSSGLSIEEASRLIQQGMQQLDDRQSRTVQAYFFQGLSLHEIAEEQNDSFGNVRHHLYRGIAKMRKFIAATEARSQKNAKSISSREQRNVLNGELRGDSGPLPSEV